MGDEKAKNETGSGITAYKITRTLIDTQAKSYVAMLEGMGVKKKQRGDMEAAYRDGMGSMLMHLREMGVVRVLSDEELERTSRGSVS